MNTILFIIVLIATSFGTTIVYNNTQQSDINYYKGHSLFDKGHYKEAIPFYEGALDKRPHRTDALKELSYSYQWTGDNKKAVETFTELMKYQSATKDSRFIYGESLLFSGNYKKAREVFQDILKKDPDSIKVKLYIADTFAYSQDFKSAEALYSQALAKKEDTSTMIKLADVLSWDKKYDQAIKLYDLALAGKSDTKLMVQKARILGWARKQKESIDEYKKALSIKYDKAVYLEMQAKKAYWNNRVNEAIKYYSELTAIQKDNVEARFDLAQIYSYQSMWKEAGNEYNKILAIDPDHFRAREGLEKLELISKRPFVYSGYEFSEADSASRDMDIRKHNYFTAVAVPVNYQFSVNALYNYCARKFADYPDLRENQPIISATYVNGSDWWFKAFYSFIDYNKDIKTMNLFGGDFNFRIFDTGNSTFMYQRERLENNSTVIVNRDYRDMFKERLDFDVNNRLKLAADYMYASYSDNNACNVPGFDILYYFSLDPKRLAIKYRYFYTNFKETLTDYFSPKHFTTNSLGVNWRHFLNKNEIFFGANDLYYDLGYDFSVDSSNVISNRFSAEFNWDINKRLNFNVKGSSTVSSSSIYRDSDVIAAIKYYF